MRSVAAALLTALALAGCSSGGSDGPLTIEETRDIPPGSQHVSVRGTLFVEFGQTTLCSGIEYAEGFGGSPMCKSPALHVEMSVAQAQNFDWQQAGDRMIAENVTLSGSLKEGILSVTR